MNPFDVARLPDCRRAAQLLVRFGTLRPPHPALALGQAVDVACAGLSRDPRTASPAAVVEVYRQRAAKLPLLPDALAAYEPTALRASEAWASHWSVAGIKVGSWGRKSPGGRIVAHHVRAFTFGIGLHVESPSGAHPETAVIFGVSSMRTPESQLVAQAQIALARQHFGDGVEVRRVDLVRVVDETCTVEEGEAALAEVLRRALSAENAAATDGLMPVLADPKPCKRCSVAVHCEVR
jgi:hypothetical protein